MRKKELIRIMEEDLSIIDNLISEKKMDVDGYRSYDELIDDSVTLCVLNAQKDILTRSLYRVKRLDDVIE